MKVKYEREVTSTVLAKYIRVGEAYHDKEGILCIRTQGDTDCSYFRVICYINGQWEEQEEYEENPVTPLMTEITVLGLRSPFNM
jgi:hypothetical protein